MNRAANTQGAGSHAHAANEHAAAHNAKTTHSSRNLLVPPPSKLNGRWVTDAASGISRYYTNDANEAHRMNRAHAAQHDQSFEAGYGTQHKIVIEKKAKTTTKKRQAAAANLTSEQPTSVGRRKAPVKASTQTPRARLPRAAAIAAASALAR